MISKLLILFLILSVLTIALSFITTFVIGENEKQLGLKYKILGGVNGTVSGMIVAVVSHWIVKNALISFWESIPFLALGAVVGAIFGIIFYTHINRLISQIMEVFSSL